MAENSTLRVDGSYVYLHPASCVPRTIEIRPDLHVDLTVGGRVIGVERIGAPVAAEDLASALFALSLPPAEPVEESTRG